MRIRGSLTKGLLIALVLSLIPVAAISAQKVNPGSICKVYKQKITYQNKVYTCIKSGKKLVWNKGVLINSTPTTSPTPSLSSDQQWSVTDSAFLEPSNMCQISRPIDFNEEFGYYGFPRGAYFMPTKGIIRSLIIPVTFVDAPATTTTSNHAEPFISDFKRFWTAMSRGTLFFDFDVLKDWVALPKTSYEYSGEIKTEQERMGNYVQVVISTVDPNVDFSKYKVVYIIPTDTIQRFFSVGPVVSSGRGSYFKSQEGPINNIVFGTKPESSLGGNKWRWLAHETGHLFGIGHPHSYENNDKKLASIFSLMDFGYVAPGLYGFERWIADWITPQQIRCVDARVKPTFNFIHKLEPLGSSSESEVIAIRLSERRVIIVENRQANEFDALPSGYEGLLVYEVDSTRITGPVKPILGSRFEIDQSKPEYNGSRVVGTLRVGESVSFEGIQISVLKNQNGSYFVRTEKK